MVPFNTGVTGQELFWIMWEAVRRLEKINLKVCCSYSRVMVPFNTGVTGQELFWIMRIVHILV